MEWSGYTIEPGADLSGAVFGQSDDCGAYLPEAQLSRANLSEAWLFEAYLSDADLTDANLAGANLSMANLAGANLAGANLAGANLSGAMADSDTRWPNGFDSVLAGVLTLVPGANLAGADLSHLSYFDGELNLTDANLAGASLVGLWYLDMVLKRANLSGADLTGANLSKANLGGANLGGANLGAVCLTGADLTGADLESAKPIGADLEYANFTGANLRLANLTGADLENADLTRANIFGANLTRANLTRANVYRTNFEGANFEGARGNPGHGPYGRKVFEECSGVVRYDKVRGSEVGRVGEPLQDEVHRNVLRPDETSPQGGVANMGYARNSAWIQALNALQVDEVYYLAPLDNLDSILTEGILPHEEVDRRGLRHLDISIQSVQQRRNARGLHGHVPLYFARRTPMSSRLRNQNSRLCLLVVDVAELCQGVKEISFTDGNAASGDTRRYVQAAELENHLPLDAIRAQFWTNVNDGKRRRSAELLVAPAVSATAIKAIEVPSQMAMPAVVSAVEGARSSHPVGWGPRCVVNAESFFDEPF